MQEYYLVLRLDPPLIKQVKLIAEIVARFTPQLNDGFETMAELREDLDLGMYELRFKSQRRGHSK
jgi:hypothetical protein